jgi:hypothetical protein
MVVKYFNKYAQQDVLDGASGVLALVGCRPGGADGDVRVFTSAMDAEVLRFITDELHSVSSSKQARTGCNAHAQLLQKDMLHVSICRVAFGLP